MNIKRERVHELRNSTRERSSADNGIDIQLIARKFPYQSIISVWK